MAKTRDRHISAFTTEEEFAAIAAAAAARSMSLSAYLRSAMCAFAEIRPFYCDDDRLLIGHLRDELKREGLNLTGLLIALNRDRSFDEAEVKTTILSMQRAIAGLCFELLRRTHPTRQSRDGGGHD